MTGPTSLPKKIEDWKNTSDSMFFLRKCGETSSPGVDTIPLNVGKIFQSKDKSEDHEDQEPAEEKSTFLFIHQTKQQQKLLARYGQMVLLDATYKTTKCAMPLLLVGVRTNITYIPVMEFICENETTECVTEALQVLIYEVQSTKQNCYALIPLLTNNTVSLNALSRHLHEYIVI